MDRNEVKKIADSFEDMSSLKEVEIEGLLAGGVRYVVIRADERRLYGKKVSIGR